VGGPKPDPLPSARRAPLAESVPREQLLRNNARFTFFCAVARGRVERVRWFVDGHRRSLELLDRHSRDKPAFSYAQKLGILAQLFVHGEQRPVDEVDIILDF
jgi:hypothetical protein